MSDAPRPTAFLGGLLTVYLVWGSTYLAMRWVVEGVPPFLGAAIRFLLAGAILYGFLTARGAKPRASRREWFAAAIIGGLMLLGGNGGVMWAEQYIASGFAALMIAMVPLLMAVLAPIFGAPRATAGVALALGLGFLGVAVLVWDRIALHDAHVGGILVLFLASLSWAVGSLLSRRVPRPRRSLEAVAMQMLAGGALLAVFALTIGEGPRFHPESVPLRSWLSLGYLVVFGSLIAYATYMWLLQVGRPNVVGTYAYVNPVVAVLLGAALAAEALTPLTIGGGTVVLIAVAAVTRLQGARPSAAKPAAAAPVLHPADDAEGSR